MELEIAWAFDGARESTARPRNPSDLVEWQNKGHKSSGLVLVGIVDLNGPWLQILVHDLRDLTLASALSQRLFVISRSVLEHLRTRKEMIAK